MIYKAKKLDKFIIVHAKNFLKSEQRVVKLEADRVVKTLQQITSVSGCIARENLAHYSRL
jgi:hypothetical protein